MFEKLLECSLFKGLDSSELKTIQSQIQFQYKKFEKEEHILSAGEKCANLLIVIEGSVRGEMTELNGKTIKIEDITACRPLAPAFLFGQNNKYPVSIISNTKSTLISIPKEMVIKLFQINKTVLTNYLNNISSRTQFLSQRIKFLSFQNIKGKLAQFILEQAGEQLKTIELQMNQTQLAELFGVTRPSLARALSEMNAEGSINAKGKLITIVNKELLIANVK